MTFLVLLFAHLLADYPLQGEFLSEMKGSNLLILMTHGGIWCGCVFTAAHFCGIPCYGWMIAVQFVVHCGADWAKANGFYRRLSENPLGLPLWIDQLIHVGQLLVIWGQQ